MEKVHEELEEAKAEIEKLKCNLDYKECIIKQLSTTNDTQRAEFSRKLDKLEGEMKELLSSIDEANEGSKEKELRVKSLLEESESLKNAVSVLQNKSEKSGNSKNSPKESIGGDFVDELHDRVRKLEEELKWKVEQFSHLEEAHEKLRDQMSSKKTEWESEKSLLIEEISRLQSSADDREKVLNVEEDNVADLKHSLRVKEMECKDFEYKLKKVEKENLEILGSLKELQEAQIPRAVPTPSAWAKLRGKLKSLEQTHKECAANLRAKEADWRYQSETLYSTLKVKDEAIEELKKELNDCKFNLTQLKMQNEELSLMLQLLRSEIDGNGEEKEGGLLQLMSQLEKEREEKRQKLEIAEETERKLRNELEQVYEALSRVDSELTDLNNHRRELELEMESWISLSEHLKRQLEVCQENRKDLEASLLDQAQVEEMLNVQSQEKDRRITNLEQQILLMDQEIRIGEGDEDENEYVRTQDEDEDEEEALRRLDDDEDDQLHLDLLARELEVAVLAHIAEERTKMHQQQNFQDDGFAKENVIQVNCGMNKSVESIIDERSPFRVLN